MDDFYALPRRRRGRPATASGASPSSPQSTGSFAVSQGYYVQTWNSSTTAESLGAGSSSARATASRIVSSVRRSFSTSARRRDSSPSGRGMYSTPEESIPPVPSRYDFRNSPDTRPTVEQIAMGLHVSRTPHLHPAYSPQSSPHVRSRYRDDSTSPHPLTQPTPQTHHRRYSAAAALTPSALPPRRSSLKKPSTPTTTRSAPLTPTASDLSLSTLTSNAPSTPRSGRSMTVPFIPSRLQLSMARLLPGRKGLGSRSLSPAVATGMSDDDSGSAELTPRKIVRFSTGVHAE
ncbi:hypothetical protein B0H21DRAFT_743778 [Amylocystis lapponica]|nr:hypothetical protein B0H21DRAFT_743778 [Amylocystis lapponica]